jgi:hypothetical protein
VPAENPTALAAGFAELAAHLGVAEGEDPVAAVHGVSDADQDELYLIRLAGRCGGVRQRTTAS